MKKFLFSVFLVLLCLSVLTPANASASLSFTKMNFYESDYNGVEHSSRVYANSFSKNSRYINGEVNFYNNNYGRASVSYKVTLKYYYPNGDFMMETSQEGVVKSEWETTWFYAGVGWREPGSWPVGRYRVEAYLNGNYLTTGYFEIYGNDKYSNKQYPNPNLVKDWEYGAENGIKTYDLYYDKEYVKTPSGTVLLNVFNYYTEYWKKNKTKDIPVKAAASGLIVEIDVNLNRYRVLTEMYADSAGNVISEYKYDNPQWRPITKGKMSERYLEIVKELTGK